MKFFPIYTIFAQTLTNEMHIAITGNIGAGKTTLAASADVSAVATELISATGAGNGVGAPAWSTGWSVGF